LADKIIQTPEVKKVVLLKGQAGEEIMELIKKSGQAQKVLAMVDNMPEAVDLLNREIERTEKEDMNNDKSQNKMEFITKDILLLSPGCASFGLFDNEFDRGRQFREEVKKVLKLK
jgi:UDP-N-acetylmuramoylalanine--D-glutamate ligase